MPRAIWNDVVVAESLTTVVVEGNHYFPPNSIKGEHFQSSSTQTECGWKGTAKYYSLVIAGQKNPDAAWYYPTPKDAAKNITGHIAFWKGVRVEV